MARCCAVCGQPLRNAHWQVMVTLWNGEVVTVDQCCYNPYQDFDRIKAYAVPFETPDPLAVREVDARLCYYSDATLSEDG